jgi:vacuolar protein sorting-associated protein 53
MDLFIAHRSAPQHENLPQNSPLLTPLVISSSSGPGGAAAAGIASLSSTAASLGTPNLSGGRFDPAIFGNAIINAARDGVDRFGSPALGSGSSTVGANHGAGNAGPTSASPPPHGADGDGRAPLTAANLNENLRNIGKFFRRDVGGGFPRFGRSGDDKS